MRVLRKSISLLVLLSVAVFLFVAMRPAEEIDPRLALEDFQRLKRHLSEAWANMEWIAGHRGVDLREANAITTDALAGVTTAGEARVILTDFVRSFRDPHFSARRVKPSRLGQRMSGGGSEEPPEITAEMSGRTVCEALKFKDRDLGFDLKFSSQRGFRPIKTRDGNPFEAGIIPLAGGKSAGLLRIAHFGEDGYPGVCRAAWEEYRKTMEAACTDGWCAGFRTLVRDRLLAYIEDRIRAMDSAGYDRLVADITGNGGGTDWVNAAVRIVSPKRLSCNRLSMVRHSHWQSILEETQQDVRNDLEREGLSSAVRERLALSDRNVQTMIDQTRAPCDRMPMWEGREPDGGCTNLVQGELYTCGLFPHLAPGDLEGITWPGILFTSFQNRYAESVNRKPLVVLVDRRTASASEDFGSILQDNGAAVLVGSRTRGAGCGFVNGGIPLVLEHVGLRVMAPDCIRHRKDGTNEIEGMEPDVALDWDGDSRTERTRKVLAALTELFMEEAGGVDHRSTFPP